MVEVGPSQPRVRGQVHVERVGFIEGFMSKTGHHFCFSKRKKKKKKMWLFYIPIIRNLASLHSMDQRLHIQLDFLFLFLSYSNVLVGADQGVIQHCQIVD